MSGVIATRIPASALNVAARYIGGPAVNTILNAVGAVQQVSGAANGVLTVARHGATAVRSSYQAVRKVGKYITNGSSSTAVQRARSTLARQSADRTRSVQAKRTNFSNAGRVFERVGPRVRRVRSSRRRRHTRRS